MVKLIEQNAASNADKQIIVNMLNEQEQGQSDLPEYTVGDQKIHTIICEINNDFELEIPETFTKMDEETLKDINKLRTKLINYKALNEEDKNILNEELKNNLDTYVDKIHQQ